MLANLYNNQKLIYRIQNMEQEMVKMQHVMGDANFQGSSLNAEKIESLSRQIEQMQIQKKQAQGSFECFCEAFLCR